MTPELFRRLLHRLQLGLERASRGEPIYMPPQDAALLLEALHEADRRALKMLGGPR